MATITIPRTFGGTLILDVPLVQGTIVPNILLTVRKGTVNLPGRKGTIMMTGRKGTITMKVREQ